MTAAAWALSLHRQPAEDAPAPALGHNDISSTSTHDHHTTHHGPHGQHDHNTTTNPVGTTTMTTTPTTVTICPAGNAQNQENEHDKARRKAKEEERDKGAEAKWQLYKNRWMRMQIVADAEMNEVEENANHGIRAIIDEKNRVRTASWLAGAGSSKDAAPQQMTAKQDAITAVQQQTAFRLRAEASTPEAATREKTAEMAGAIERNRQAALARKVAKQLAVSSNSTSGTRLSESQLQKIEANKATARSKKAAIEAKKAEEKASALAEAALHSSRPEARKTQKFTRRG